MKGALIEANKESMSGYLELTISKFIQKIINNRFTVDDPAIKDPLKLKLNKVDHQRAVSRWWRGLNMISLQCETPEEFQLWTSRDKMPDVSDAWAIKQRWDQATNLAKKIEAKLLIWVNDLGGGRVPKRKGGEPPNTLRKEEFLMRVLENRLQWLHDQPIGLETAKAKTYAIRQKKRKLNNA